MTHKVATGSCVFMMTCDEERFAFQSRNARETFSEASTLWRNVLAEPQKRELVYAHGDVVHHA